MTVHTSNTYPGHQCILCRCESSGDCDDGSLTVHTSSADPWQQCIHCRCESSGTSAWRRAGASSVASLTRSATGISSTFRSAFQTSIGLLGQQATKVRAMDPIDPCEATGDRDAKDSKPSEVCGGDGGVRAGEGRDTALGVLRVAARQLRVWSVVTPWWSPSCRATPAPLESRHPPFLRCDGDAVVVEALGDVGGAWVPLLVAQTTETEAGAGAATAAQMSVSGALGSVPRIWWRRLMLLMHARGRRRLHRRRGRRCRRME